MIARDGDGQPGKMEKRDFTSLREILDRSFTSRLARQRGRLETLRDAWKEAVGEDVARLSRISRFREGKLFVEVSSAPLLLELSSFRKQEILDRLQISAAFRGLVDIVFRSG